MSHLSLFPFGSGPPTDRNDSLQGSTTCPSVLSRTKFFDKEGFFNAKCGASRTIRAIGRAIPIHSSDELKIVCEHQGGTPCHPLKQPCLFDIEADPCEMDNIAKQHPEVHFLVPLYSPGKNEKENIESEICLKCISHIACASSSDELSAGACAWRPG